MNALGNNDARRIPIRQRSLHPSMLGWLDVASSSSSDPGQSGDLSPYSEMHSMYFDDSLYENEMHFKIAKYLDENPLEDGSEEIVIKCDTEEQYNSTLDALFKAAEGRIKISGTSNNPMEIVVARDPREDYRKFDESFLMDNNTKGDI